MERIYMDEFHYESYDNYKEALDAWSTQTAHTQIAINAELDYDIGVEMSGLSDIIMFDEAKLAEYIGTEGIKDKVKNMASRVKSNLTLWIKKFVNFFFGWIVNFFKGVVNIRKSLKAGFDKAKEYLKKLNEMSGKLGTNDKDKEGENKTVKVSKASPILIKCLSTVLISSYLLGKLGPLLANIKTDVENADKQEVADNEGNGKGQKILDSQINGIINKLTAGIIAIGGVSAICDPRDGNFYTEFKNRKYSIEQWAGDSNNESLKEALNKKFNDEQTANTIYGWIGSIIDAAQDKIKAFFEGNSEATNESNNMLKDISAKIKAVLGDSAKSIEQPEPEEQPYTKAFAMIKESLNAFINIASANKTLWNFEKNAEGFEKVRRRILPLIDKYNPENEQAGNELFNRVANIGQLMSAVSSNANKCMQHVNTLLDTVITDATRLGAAITSASGKN